MPELRTVTHACGVLSHGTGVGILRGVEVNHVTTSFQDAPKNDNTGAGSAVHLLHGSDFPSRSIVSLRKDIIPTTNGQTSDVAEG